MPLDFIEVYHVKFDEWYTDARGEHLADEGDVDCQLANQLHETRDAVCETHLPNRLRLGHLPDEVGQVLDKFFFGKLIEYLVEEAEEDVLERSLFAGARVARGAVQFAHQFEVFFPGRLIFALGLLSLGGFFGPLANEHTEVVDHLLSDVALLDVFQLDLCYSAVLATAFLLLGVLTAGAALSLLVSFAFASFRGSGVFLTHGRILLFHVDLLGGLFVVLFAAAPILIVALASVTVTATLTFIVESLRVHFELLHLFLLDLVLRLELFIMTHVLLPARLLVIGHVLDQQLGPSRCLILGASAMLDIIELRVD